MAEPEEQPVEEVEAEAGGPMAGERLAAARRDMQISIVEVAKELHLDETKVRALERNEFEALGAAVFAKGHLRKYAEIVDVDIDDIMTDYYQLTRGDSAPPIVAGRAKQRQELSPGPWIAVAIVVLVIAVAYWWFGIRTPASSTSSSPPPQASPAEIATEAPAQTPAVADPEPVAAESAPVTEPAEMPEQADGAVELAAEVADESTDASAAAEINDTVASAEPASSDLVPVASASATEATTAPSATTESETPTDSDSAAGGAAGAGGAGACVAGARGAGVPAAGPFTTLTHVLAGLPGRLELEGCDLLAERVGLGLRVR